MDGKPLTRGSDPLAHFSDPHVVWKTLPADAMAFFLLFTQFWARNCTSADLMTFFVGLHPILGKKLDICGPDDLFFALHPILGGKLVICGRDDLFLVFTRFWAKNWTYADVMTFFWSSPVFGRKIGHLRTRSRCCRSVVVCGALPVRAKFVTGP